MPEDISAIRKDYSKRSLSEKEVATDPFLQFESWWKEAVAANIDEVNAMTLATASMDAVPSARIVLLKGFSKDGFIFFSNYDSYKGQQLAENPKACLVFFWKELQRQIRITGLVMKVTATESDKYFDSRPEDSRIGASISPQSQVIENREWLDSEFQKKKNEIVDKTIERPSNWGGYIVKPVIIEFWQGGSNRLHDRIQYTLQDDGSWTIERLAP